MSTMPETLVIVNTSPLLYLYQVDCLELLQQLYGTITVPPAVPQELETGKLQGVDVPEVNSIEWIQIRPVASATIIPAVIDLGQGEAEVIALGLENPGSLLVFDDSLARRIADLYGLKYTGTLGVLVKAKQSGYLSAVAPIITMLRSKGMWLTDKIISDVLRLSGE
jgi:predicted nucleic acid-binding protein